MPQTPRGRVKIQGVGWYKFPDEMTDAEIESEIQNYILPEAWKKDPKGMFAAYTTPEQQKAFAQSEKSMEKPKDPGVVRTLVTDTAMIPAGIIKGAIHASYTPPWQTVKGAVTGWWDTYNRLLDEAQKDREQAWKEMKRGDYKMAAGDFGAAFGRTIAAPWGPFGAAAVGTGEIMHDKPGQAIGETIMQTAPGLVGEALRPVARAAKTAITANRLGPERVAQLNEFEARASAGLPKGAPPRATLSRGERSGNVPLRTAERSLAHVSIGSEPVATRHYTALETELERQAKESTAKVAPRAVKGEVDAGRAIENEFEGYINQNRGLARNEYSYVENKAAANKQTLRLGQQRVVSSTGKVSWVPITDDFEAPVALKPIRASLRPLYERMDKLLTIAQKEQNPGWKALSDVMRDTDELTGKPRIYKNAMALEGDLQAIKKLTRESVRSKLLTGQPAAVGLRVINAAEQQLGRVLNRLEPGLYARLQKGRAFAQRYIQADELLTKLMGGTGRGGTPEPASIFRAMVSDNDAHFAQLQRIDHVAPQASRELARGYFEGMLQDAFNTPSGRMGNTARLVRNWDALGAKTKELWLGPKLTKELDTVFENMKTLVPAEGSPTGWRLPIVEGIAGIGNMVASLMSGHPIDAASAAGHAAFAAGGMNILARVLFREGGGSALWRVINPTTTSLAFRAAVHELEGMGVVAAREEMDRVERERSRKGGQPSAPAQPKQGASAQPLPPITPEGRQEAAQFGIPAEASQKLGAVAQRLDPQGQYPMLARAMRITAGIESTGRQIDPKTGKIITSPKGALGMMQIMPDTARLYGGDPTNEDQNMVIGGKILRDLMARYRNDMPKVFAAYNSNPKTVDYYHGVPPRDKIKETYDYVVKAMRGLGVDWPGSAMAATR